MKLLPSFAQFKAIYSHCETCKRSWALRNLPSRKIGIRMHDFWYCGPRCFTAAVEKEISRLLVKVVDVGSTHVERMPMGLALVSRGCLSIEQLREVTHDQKAIGREIGELLLERGLVTEKQVTAVRAAQWNCPVFAIPKGVYSTIHIPMLLIRVYFTLPLHYVPATNVLLVGFVLNIEYGLLYAMERITGCKTQACFLKPSDFQAQLDLQQLQQAEDEMTFEGVKGPAVIARILCEACLDRQADEVSISKCKDYVWARLKHGDQVADLVLRIG